MVKTHQTIRAGTSIVFEGLDRTGKSTQLDMLRDALDPDSVVFAHMPSGFAPFTNRVYAALEAKDMNGVVNQAEKPSSGLAQQLAHLACHAESMSHLVEATQRGGLVLDRWWWSTLAYGWFGGSVEQSGLSKESFQELIGAIWHPIKPAVVFVFLEPHQLDSNNNAGVEAGYRYLLSEAPQSTVVVPNDATDRTHEFVMANLAERDLLVSI